MLAAFMLLSRSLNSGQTGTGKTHTMLGLDVDALANSGLPGPESVFQSEDKVVLGSVATESLMSVAGSDPAVDGAHIRSNRC